MISYTLTQKDFRILARQQILKKAKVPLIIFSVLFVIGLYFLIVGAFYDREPLITGIVSVGICVLVFIWQIVRYVQLCRAYAKLHSDLTKHHIAYETEITYNQDEIIVRYPTLEQYAIEQSAKNDKVETQSPKLDTKLVYKKVDLQPEIFKSFVAFSVPNEQYTLIVPRNDTTKDFLALYNIK